MLSTMRYPPETGNATSILLLRANAMMALVPNVVAASNVPANATNLRRVTLRVFGSLTLRTSDSLRCSPTYCKGDLSAARSLHTALTLCLPFRFEQFPWGEGNLKVYYEQTAIPTYPCKAKYMGQTFGIYGLAIEWRILLGE